MKHLRLTWKEPIPESHLWNAYFQGLRIGVLDIETTGLDHRRNRFILGGLYDPEEKTFHQIFAESPDKEMRALALFLSLMDGMDVLVTYNGRQFDLPFLRQRAATWGIPFPAALYDLDLYQVVNGHSPLRRLLPNLRQKTVEDYLGLWTTRTDEISGAESIQLYERFVRTGDRALAEKILLHNSDDVMQLTRLIPVIGKCDFHQAMNHMGFPLRPAGRRLLADRIELVRDELVIEGGQIDDPAEFHCYELDGFPLRAEFRAADGRFSLRVPLIRNSGIAAVDLRASGVDETAFAKYPESGSGYLVLQDHDRLCCREINHFACALAERLAPLVYPRADRTERTEAELSGAPSGAEHTNAELPGAPAPAEDE